MDLIPIPIEDGELSMLAQLPMPIGNADILARLLAETPWRADTVVVYGKQYLQPRLTAWYGEASYTYSGLTLHPLPLTPLLEQLRTAVEQARSAALAVVLCAVGPGGDFWCAALAMSTGSPERADA